MESKIVMVRDSVAGKGLELAESMLKEGIKVMINGPEQEKIIELLNILAHKYPADLLYGVPGTILSVEEYSRFYSNPMIQEVVTAP